MSLLGHGMPPPEKAPSFMASLYQTNTHETAAAAELLSFEGRTPIQGLPAQTGATEALLKDIADELASSASPFPFWPLHSLQVRDGKNGRDLVRRPHLVAPADACMATLSRARPNRSSPWPS